MCEKITHRHTMRKELLTVYSPLTAPSTSMLQLNKQSSYCNALASHNEAESFHNNVAKKNIGNVSVLVQKHGWWKGTNLNTDQLCVNWGLE